MKPYTEYKTADTPWLHSVPAHWGLDKIGMHFLERKTKVSDRDYLPLSVSMKGTVPQLVHVAKTKDGDNRKLVKAGDFVINSRSDRKGSSGVSPIDGSVSLINTVLIPQDVLPLWSHYLFRSRKFIEEYYRNGRGIVADLWTTRYSEMRTILIPVPTYEEQVQIVRFLEWKIAKVNRFIRQKRSQIKHLRTLRTTIITKSTTKGLRDTVKFKPSGNDWLGEVPEHWEVKRVSPLFSFAKGYNISRADMQTTGLPCIHYGDIHGHCSFEVDLSKQIVGCVDDTKYCFDTDDYLKYGDFLFVGSSEDLEGSGNFTWYNSDRKAIAGTDTIRLRTNREINHRFVAYMFDSQSFRNQIRVLVNGVKVYHPTQTMIKRAYLVLPSIEEQTEIVEYLDRRCADIDNMISALKTEITLITEYRARMISDVVTGKVDVRGIEVPDIASENNSEDVAEDETLDEEGIADENEEVQEDADD